MDEKTKKAIVAIFAALVSLIASVLGCVFGIPTDSFNGAMDDITLTNSAYRCLSLADDTADVASETHCAEII